MTNEQRMTLFQGELGDFRPNYYLDGIKIHFTFFGEPWKIENMICAGSIGEMPLPQQVIDGIDRYYDKHDKTIPGCLVLSNHQGDPYLIESKYENKFGNCCLPKDIVSAIDDFILAEYRNRREREEKPNVRS